MGRVLIEPHGPLAAERFESATVTFDGFVLACCPRSFALCSPLFEHGSHEIAASVQKVGQVFWTADGVSTGEDIDKDSIIHDKSLRRIGKGLAQSKHPFPMSGQMRNRGGC
jgi:hypothetical protein